MLLVATSPRPVRFLAKSTLWKVPAVGPLLGLAGVLPVYRRQDGSDTGDNAKSFAACDAELAVDGAIGIFPEGTVNDTLKLLPLRTGAARIALGARAAGADALRIVPVGLLYEDKATPRTRVLVRARDRHRPRRRLARPRRAAAARGDADDHVAVDRLTALITDALTDAYVSYDDESDLRRLEHAARIALRPPGADPSHLRADGAGGAGGPPAGGAAARAPAAGPRRGRRLHRAARPARPGRPRRRAGQHPAPAAATG